MKSFLLQLLAGVGICLFWLAIFYLSRYLVSEVFK